MLGHGTVTTNYGVSWPPAAPAFIPMLCWEFPHVSLCGWRNTVSCIVCNFRHNRIEYDIGLHVHWTLSLPVNLIHFPEVCLLFSAQRSCNDNFMICYAKTINFWVDAIAMYDVCCLLATMRTWVWILVTVGYPNIFQLLPIQQASCLGCAECPSGTIKKR